MVELDPDDGTVLRTVRLAFQPATLLVGDDVVCVHVPEGQLVRVDPRPQRS